MSEHKIVKHLATVNLWREADNSIHVTFAEAEGVRSELGDSGAPLGLCAMNALRSAVELRHSPTHDEAFSRIVVLEAVLNEQNDWLWRFVDRHNLKAKHAAEENLALKQAYHRAEAESARVMLAKITDTLGDGTISGEGE